MSSVRSAGGGVHVSATLPPTRSRVPRSTESCRTTRGWPRPARKTTSIGAPKFAELRAEIAELKRYLTESNQRFWDAVGYIRRLIAALRNHVPDDELPDPRTTRRIPVNRPSPSPAGAGFVVLAVTGNAPERWQMKASYGRTQWTIPAQRAV